MAKKIPLSPADYILPLNMNGLEGRMLRLPPRGRKTSETLLIYGHHSSLERWWGLALALNRYTGVTMPDLPGFGGMDSFYTIGKEPSLDNLADYLAAFIRLRYKKRQKIVIAGMSLGFVIATRMLQRYPELTDRVSMMISIVGFAHRDDFILSKSRIRSYLILTSVFKHRPLNYLFRYGVLNSKVIRAGYARTNNAKNKFNGASDSSEFDRLMDVEIGLWQDNEVRTYMYTTNEFFHLDNCDRRVNLPVWHIGNKNDHFFDNHLVEQHMRVVFKDFIGMYIDMQAHAPSVMADEKEAMMFIPPRLRRELAKLR